MSTCYGTCHQCGEPDSPALFLDLAAPQRQATSQVVEAPALFDTAGLVRTCGGCSRPLGSCRCSAVGILAAPSLFE